MMTRTTLKALWVGGGGILATWIAVAPNHAVPAATVHSPEESFSKTSSFAVVKASAAVASSFSCTFSTQRI